VPGFIAVLFFTCETFCLAKLINFSCTILSNHLLYQITCPLSYRCKNDIQWWWKWPSRDSAI